MKLITAQEFRSNPAKQFEIKEALQNGEVICFPTPSGYKLAVDLASPGAVAAIIMAKRRVNNAPALVFMPDLTWVGQIATNVRADAWPLMKNLWPGPLTLLFEPNEALPRSTVKILTKAKGWLGIRIPDDEISTMVLNLLQKPMLVSSANLSKKNGENSVAQVKKNFGRTASILIDNGDLKAGEKSTLLDMTQTIPEVIRQGAISEESIRSALRV